MGDFTFTGPGNPCFASPDSKNEVIDQFGTRMWKRDSICCVSRFCFFPLLKFLKKFPAGIDPLRANEKIDNLANSVGVGAGTQVERDLVRFNQVGES